MSSFIDENQQFIDSDGNPIVNGYIYIGTQNADPVLNPITIYSDRSLETVLANPQRTDADGRAANKIWIPARYSLKVEDENNVQKLQDLDAGEVAASGVTSLVDVQGINAITANANPNISTLTDNETYVFQTASANTSAVTLEIGTATAATIKKNHDQDLVSGDFKAGQVVAVTYNEADDVFELISNVSIVIKNNDAATAAPTVSNDNTEGYSVGSRWSDVTNDKVYQALDVSTGAAVWRRVDDNAEVGDLFQSFRATKDSCLLLYGQTIGSASSGADVASAAYLDLYTVLWDNCADSECPVSSGRGASAAADFAADKTLTLPDGRGRVLLGKDNMGGSSADVVTNAAADALGDTEGSETHTLTKAELPTHQHTSAMGTGETLASAGGDFNAKNGTGSSNTGDGSADGLNGDAHNNMQPYLTTNTFIKY